MTSSENSSSALWNLSAEKLRQRCLWTLVICLIWAFCWATIGWAYHWGAATATHPHTTSYIPWWGWAAWAAVPLVAMSIVVEVLLGIAGARARKKGANNA